MSRGQESDIRHPPWQSKTCNSHLISDVDRFLDYRQEPGVPEPSVSLENQRRRPRADKRELAWSGT
jgi:hypothetical protein